MWDTQGLEGVTPKTSKYAQRPETRITVSPKCRYPYDNIYRRDSRDNDRICHLLYTHPSSFATQAFKRSPRHAHTNLEAENPRSTKEAQAPLPPPPGLPSSLPPFLPLYLLQRFSTLERDGDHLPYFYLNVLAFLLELVPLDIWQRSILLTDRNDDGKRPFFLEGRGRWKASVCVVAFGQCI